MNQLILFGLLSALLVAGCAHKSVSTSQPQSRELEFSQKFQILLASAEQIPLNAGFDQFDDEFSEDMDQISDPLEPINRVFYHFNDKLYFWFFKPLAKGYKYVIPEPARVSVRNFSYNLTFPIRFINNLLQGKLEGAGFEFVRFIFNSTVGFAGFFDLASSQLDLPNYDEDFGQTLGAWGLGQGIYLNLPVLGASSLRDGVGLAGDTFLDPVNYLSEYKYAVAAHGYDTVNKTSLAIGDYEDLKRSALDPYIAIRDAYYQYRRAKVEE